jgi:hypothetical protein
MSYEGAPAEYQIERIAVLEAELADIEQQFENLLSTDLPGVNRALQGVGVEPLVAPAKVPAMADAGVSSANARWLETRGRQDKKQMFHSLPQGPVDLR